MESHYKTIVSNLVSISREDIQAWVSDQLKIPVPDDYLLIAEYQNGDTTRPTGIRLRWDETQDPQKHQPLPF